MHSGAKHRGCRFTIAVITPLMTDARSCDQHTSKKRGVVARTALAIYCMHGFEIPVLYRLAFGGRNVGSSIEASTALALAY